MKVLSLRWNRAQLVQSGCHMGSLGYMEDLGRWLDEQLPFYSENLENYILSIY